MDEMAAGRGGALGTCRQRNVSAPREAESLAQRLRASLSRPVQVGNHGIRISACIGYGVSEEGEDLEALIALADGIHGKRTLWNALQRIAPSVPALRGFDFPQLIARADEALDNATRAGCGIVRHGRATPAKAAPE